MVAAPAPAQAVAIYSREDLDLLKKLLAHLAPLKHQGILDVWYDQHLDPGAGWREEIESHLRKADIVLVLVSALSLASVNCRAEIELAMELHGERGLHVVPIKLHDIDWEGEPLSELQALPKNVGSLSESADLNKEMAGIAREIRKLAASIRQRKAVATSAVHGPREALESPAGMRAANDQALALADHGDLAAARVLLEQTIRLAREVASSDLAVLLSNYAHVLLMLGDLGAAQAALEEALDRSASSDPARAVRLDRLARVLREMGDTDRAGALAREALEISLKAHGRNHPAVAVRLNTLGLIWLDLGESGKAVRAFKRSLSIFVRFPERQSALAGVHGNLALALREQGNLTAAKHHADLALAGDGKAYADQHPAIATDLNTLGLILRDQGSISAANQSLQKALEMFSRLLGDIHPYTRAVADNLQGGLREAF